jgi:hypothetical protein
MGDSAEYARRDRARRTARARVEAALADYVDLLIEQEPTRSRRDSDELARLCVAYRIRDEVAELAEQQVDRSIEAARRRPRGHSWAEIGEAMDGHTGQAAGKRARQRGLDTGRAWAPSAAATARAERAEQRRAQRALTQALTEAATRWPGRRLHRVDHDDGMVTFEPDPPAVPLPAAVPPPSPALPVRCCRSGAAGRRGHGRRTLRPRPGTVSTALSGIVSTAVGSTNSRVGHDYSSWGDCFSPGRRRSLSRSCSRSASW